MDLRIGDSLARTDGDVVTLQLSGDVSREDMRAILALLDEIVVAHGQFFILGDLRGLRSIAPDARRLAGGWKSVEHSAGAAVFGASATTRVVISLLSRAMELLQRRAHRGPLEFFKTEEEARAWLQRQRERVRGSPSDK